MLYRPNNDRNVRDITEKVISIINGMDPLARKSPEKHYDHIFRSHLKNMLEGNIMAAPLSSRSNMEFYKVLGIEKDNINYIIHIKTIRIDVVEELVPRLLIDSIQIHDMLEKDFTNTLPTTLRMNAFGLLIFKMKLHRDRYKDNVYKYSIEDMINNL